jgi:hypothetical protein
MTGEWFWLKLMGLRVVVIVGLLVVSVRRGGVR